MAANATFVPRANIFPGRYLETDRPKLNGTTQPWVWVALIAFGPIASTLAEQRFYISSVCFSIIHLLLLS
jgi:hypothetical protein